MDYIGLKIYDAKGNVLGEERFVGILPDLFREGQGVIAEGVMEQTSRFAADTVLAKHDENYMPKEVADTLKEKGIWQGEAQ